MATDTTATDQTSPARNRAGTVRRRCAIAIFFASAFLLQSGGPLRGADAIDPRVEKIVSKEILPPYTTKAGFAVKPAEIRYDSNKNAAALIDREPPIWKQFDRAIAANYARIQKEVNGKLHPAGDKYRGPLRDAFDRVASIGMGGSAWSQTCTFIPAHVEWVIAQIDSLPAGKIGSDAAFVREIEERLIASAGLPELAADDRWHKEREPALQKIAKDMKLVAGAVGEKQAGALRADLLSFFFGE